jgi:GDP-L-fucose synthase
MRGATDRDPEPRPLINIGTGEDLTIAELAELIAQVVGFHGRFVYDKSKPDGTPRKVLDVARLRALGWSPQIPLREGIADAYRDFLARIATCSSATRD